jgi:L-rhamnose mutarotase
MKEFALTLNLKDDPHAIEQYKAWHRQVWPEVVQSLRKVGIQELRIYLLGRRMFMIVRTIDAFDPSKDFARYLEQSPKCPQWEELMGQFQERVPEAKPGEKWAMMEKVYDLEW